MKIKTRIRKVSKSTYVLVPKPFSEEIRNKKAYLIIDEKGNIRIEFE